jgi:hypothetical protein
MSTDSFCFTPTPAWRAWISYRQSWSLPQKGASGSWKGLEWALRIADSKEGALQSRFLGLERTNNS